MNKMKRLPIAVGIMVLGTVYLIISAANNWVIPETVCSITVFAGFIWFCFIWSNIHKLLIPLKSHYKRCRRREEAERERMDAQELRNKSIDHKINALQTRQSMKGQITTKDGKLLYMERRA